GKKPSIVDANTGDRVEVELFVAVMGASNYTYVEATATQRSADWIASHPRHRNCVVAQDVGAVAGGPARSELRQLGRSRVAF
ncbi:MAG TPA: hypothetical protein VNO30_41015, partial [Kofleriaceae bacterium]|nr:hypothetical protein [Kofleriaceae bacterium]